MSILSKSEDFKFISLDNKEENDYVYLSDLNMLINNYDLISSYFNKYDYEENSLDSFVDLLFLKKINTYENRQSKIDENIEIKLNKLIYLSNLKGKNDFNRATIQFINKHFKEIFTASIHQLEEVVINLIFKFQNGINKNVFEYLIVENKYLLLNNYDRISKVFENDIELLNELFSDSNILDFCQVRLKEMIRIYRYLNRKKELKHVSERVIDGIIKYGHSIKNSFEDREFIHVSIEIKNIYKLLNFEKHIEANNFNTISEELKIKLDKQLMENGKSFSQEIPVGKIVDELMKNIKYPFTILSVSHEINSLNPTLKSRLDFKSNGKENLLDKISTNNDSDDFFTLSHKNKLNFTFLTPVATLHHLFINCDSHFESIVNLYDSIATEINTKVSGAELIKNDDFEALFQMIFNLKNNKNEEAIILQIQSYTICVFLCSFIEKILRDFYFYLVKDSKYVPINKITLSDLIDSKKNPEMHEIFGENHLKHLKYFLLNEGEKKIGFNYRNRLAHWRDINWEEMDTFSAFKLLYLFTDVINTIYIHLVLNPYLDGKE